MNEPAGVPVYFMIGTSGGTEGGQFYFSVQRPLEVGVAANAQVSVTKAGVATVSGSTTCSRAAGFNANLTLRQTFAGRLNAFGLASVSMPCSPVPASGSAALTSWPVLFGPGVGVLEGQIQSICDSQGCQPGALWDEHSYDRRESVAVMLRKVN